MAKREGPSLCVFGVNADFLSELILLSSDDVCGWLLKLLLPTNLFKICVIERKTNLGRKK